MQKRKVCYLKRLVNQRKKLNSNPYNLILKYADDTYIIIPANNIQSRSVELQNVEQWAATNNLKLNRAKTNEIIITTKGKSKSLQPMPPLLPDIVRVTRLKILGVTVSDKLSISEHVQQVAKLSVDAHSRFVPSGF